VVTYSYNANDELDSASDGSSYLYDGNGNVVSATVQGNTRLFTYDYENRIISAQYSGTTVYNYSGDGRLMTYSIPGHRGYICSAFVYSHMPGLATVVMHADQGGGAYKIYWNVPGTDESLGFAYNNTLYGSLYLTFVDGLGNTRFGISGDFLPQEVYVQSYSPFGEMANAPTGSYLIWLDLPSFQGRRFDPNTGTYDFRVRYYDQTTGRFVQRDPQSTLGLSSYAFVGNNPLTGRDPTGMSWTGACSGVLILGIFNLILDVIGLKISISYGDARYAWAVHAATTQGANAMLGGIWSFMGWLLRLSLDIAYDVIKHMGFFSMLKWLGIFAARVGFGWPVILAIAVYDVGWIFYDLASMHCF
jgi:RHS repeat-associated protein